MLTCFSAHGQAGTVSAFVYADWGASQGGRGRAVAAAGGGVRGQRVPGRHGDRVRDRGVAAVTGPDGPRTARERGGDGGGLVRDHLDVPAGLGGPLQPRCGLCPRGFWWAAVAGR